MSISSKQYAEALYQAVKEAQATERESVIQSFLSRLQKQGDLSLLSRIVEYVQELENDALGITPVEVRVAHEPSESELKETLQSLLGAKKIQLDIKEDKELIGGFVAETKNLRWDMSMKNQLNRLRQSL